MNRFKNVVLILLLTLLGNFMIQQRVSANEISTETQTTINSGPDLDIADNVSVNYGEAVSVPVTYSSNGNSISSTIFSIDIDQSCLAFDATDANSDGIPDAITLNLPAGFNGSATYDASDTDGELDFFFADTFVPLASLTDGVLVTIEFSAICQPAAGSTTNAPLIFATTPAVSFGNTSGQAVSGTTSNGSIEIHSAPTVDLILTKTVDETWFLDSGTPTYTIQVTNNGAVTVTGIEITDFLPTGSGIWSVTRTGVGFTQGSYDGITDIWTVGDLTSSSSATLTLYTTLSSVFPADGTTEADVVNTATITAIDSPYDNNLNLSASANFTVQFSEMMIDPCISINKTVSSMTPHEQDTLVYTITVINTAEGSNGVSLQ